MLLRDLIVCLKRWRLAHLLGIAGLRARYARSVLGQFWLSVFTLVQIVSIGLVWSIIWKMEIKAYLPYVGVGHVFYLWVSQSINESSSCIVAEARMFYNDPFPVLLAVLAHVYRQLVIFLHNLPLLVLLIIYGGVTPHPLMAILGFALSFLFVVSCSIGISLLATRFRDLIQLIGLVFTVAFLVTPVMWKLDFVPANLRVYFLLNPLASVLEITRNPLLGLPFPGYAFLILAGWTIAALIIAALIYRKYRKSFIFWV